MKLWFIFVCFALVVLSPDAQSCTFPSCPSVTTDPLGALITNLVTGLGNLLGTTVTQIGTLISATLQGLATALGLVTTTLSTVLQQVGLTPTGCQTILSIIGITPAQFKTILNQPNCPPLQTVLNTCVQNVFRICAGNTFLTQLSYITNVPLLNITLAIVNAGITPSNFIAICIKLNLTPQYIASLYAQNNQNFIIVVQIVCQQWLNSQNILTILLNSIFNLLNGLVGIVGGLLSGIVHLVVGTLASLGSVLGVVGSVLSGILASLGLTATSLQTCVNALGTTTPQFQTIVSQNQGNVTQAVQSLIQQVTQSSNNYPIFFNITVNIQITLMTTLLQYGLTPCNFQNICNNIGVTAPQLATQIGGNANNCLPVVQDCWTKYQNKINSG